MASDEKVEEKRLLAKLGKALISTSAQKSKSLERVAYEAGVSKGKANPSVLILSRLVSALDIPLWKFMKFW